MKNLPLIFLSFLISLGACLVTGCQKDKEEPNCGKESKQYEFFENSYLDIQYPNPQSGFPYIQISEGDTGKIVFQYLRLVDESSCPWSDGGQGDWLLFEVDESLTEFNFEDEALTTANVFAGRYSGFAGSFFMQPVLKGEISGKKLNLSEWYITTDITLNGHDYKLGKKFKRQ